MAHHRVVVEAGAGSRTVRSGRALGETPPGWLHQVDIDVEIPIPKEMHGPRRRKRARLEKPKRKRTR